MPSSYGPGSINLHRAAISAKVIDENGSKGIKDGATRARGMDPSEKDETSKISTYAITADVGSPFERRRGARALAVWSLLMRPAFSFLRSSP